MTNKSIKQYVVKVHNMYFQERMNITQYLFDTKSDGAKIFKRKEEAQAIADKFGGQVLERV